jgi:hypothetical protein
MRASSRIVLLIACLWVRAGWGAAAETTPAATPLGGMGKRSLPVETNEWCVVPPPAELRFDPFYTKCVRVRGFPVIASGQVSDYAVREAAWIIGQMLADRPDILDALTANGVRCAVMASSELTTQIPEHSDLTPAKFWDRRARGLGPTPERPAVSCGEENLLCYPGDPYAAENILVHEFAHAIHLMGLNTVDPTFDGRLKQTYDQALAQGLWQGKYAANNHAEYWAEGVQSWFDTNRPPDHDHNHVDTREELKEYDAGLAALVEEVFGDGAWRYQRPADRAEAAHLAGYDPAAAPTFAWPAELQAWYDNYTAEQKKDE